MANIVVSSGIHEFMQAADYAAARTVLLIEEDFLPLTGGMMNSGAEIRFDNYAKIRQTPNDYGLDLVCSVDYVHRWKNGSLYIMDQSSGIRSVNYGFDITPTQYFDSTQGYLVGSRYAKDDGTIFECTDNTADNAVWEDVTPASGNHTHAVFIGDTGNGGVAGFVPAPSSGDGAALKYLNASGTWSVPAGGGGAGTKTYAVFTALDSQPPATNFATLDTRNSIAVLDFDGGSTNEETTFVGILPEGADVSSGLKVRIHWTATSATSGNCRWGIQFEKSGTDLDSDSFDVATEAHTATNGTAGIETITEITATSIDSITAGDRFRIKVYRDASDATNDTMTGDAELIAVEIRSAV